jgi:hypothetical protein
MAKQPKEPEEPFESDSVPQASREDFQDFLSRVKKAQESIKDDDVLVRQQALRAYLGEHYDAKTLGSFLLRAYGDALKSPSQKLGTAKAPPDERPRTRTRKAERGGKTLARKRSRRRF